MTDEYDLHCISHCKNLENIDNVFLNYFDNFDLKRLRDNGKLLNLLNDVINK